MPLMREKRQGITRDETRVIVIPRIRKPTSNIVVSDASDSQVLESNREALDLMEARIIQNIVNMGNSVLTQIKPSSSEDSSAPSIVVTPGPIVVPERSNIDLKNEQAKIIQNISDVGDDLIDKMKAEGDALVLNITNVGNDWLGKIKDLGDKIMASIADLERSVERSTTVQKSAIILIQGLAEQIRNAGSDPVKLGELADKLDLQATDLADAVAANTKADPIASVAAAAPPSESVTP